MPARRTGGGTRTLEPVTLLGMNNEPHNSEQVRKTLDLVLPLLNELNIEYRTLGSVVMAAINGGLHRRLGDLDLIIQRGKNAELKQRLLDVGYYERPGIFGFARKYLSLETLDHDKLLEVGLFIGDFKPDGSFVIGTDSTNISVDSHAAMAHHYHLLGQTIVGLQPEIIARGVHSSPRNPKRKDEMVILSNNGINPASKHYIHVRVLGVKADWIYYFSMWLLDILGMARVVIGKPYDPWR